MGVSVGVVVGVSVGGVLGVAYHVQKRGKQIVSALLNNYLFS